VAKHESNFNPRAMNWNCRYGGKSTFCKEEDRNKAWSVDCGLFQVNFKGNKCPEYLFDVDVNISQFITMYMSRGWQPWNASRKNWSKEVALLDT